MKQWLQHTNKGIICAQTIVDSVQDILLILDNGLNVVSANKAFYSLFNTIKQKIENHYFFALEGFQWENPELKPQLQSILSTNGHFNNFEISQNFPNIGKKTLLFNAQPILQEGRVQFYLVTIEDITKIRQDQIQHKKIESQYKKYVEDSRSIIIGFDSLGKITFFNKFAESIFGYNRHEMIGKPVVGSIIPVIESSGRTNSSLWQQIQQDPQQLYSGINEGICKNGKKNIFFLECPNIL